MAKSWDDVMRGEKLSQEDIKELSEGARGMIRGANATLDIARKQLEILRGICQHPRKKNQCCPDCGADWSPD